MQTLKEIEENNQEVLDDVQKIAKMTPKQLYNFINEESDYNDD